MSTYPVDIKSTQLTSAAAAQTIFAGPCRILGVYYLSDVASGGSIEILDGTTSLCNLQFLMEPVNMKFLIISNFLGRVFIVQRVEKQL